MIILGLDISGGNICIAILDGTRVKHSNIAVATKKLALPDYPAAKKDIQGVVSAVNALISQHKVDGVVFKKLPTSGQYTSAITLYWQGILASQLSVVVHYVAAQTMAATNKKSAGQKISSGFKYLQEAYNLAFEKLT